MNLWNNALCELDEDIVAEYASALLKNDKKKIGRPAFYYVGIAACIAAGLFAAVMLGKSLYGKLGPQTPVETKWAETALETFKATAGDESEETVQDTAFERQYMTTVLDSDFSDYHSVRVCDEAFVGEKLKEITVEGGWKNSDYEYIEPAETLRATVYSLKDVPIETAVCLKFIDLGDALTTTHYYVYVRDDVSEETLTALKERFGWNVKPTPGAEDNGTVMMTTSSGED